jgi:predicted SAM-dependent methyltransferase
VNIDIVRYPGVDRILDVRRGLPFKDVRFIFAEHFVEHLDLNDAMYLFLECRRVLRDDGVLRLSTPNLDWVWGIALRRCRQQRGSGPRLFQTEWRVSRLLDAGFASVAISGYGESSYAELRASSPASGAASRPTVVSVIKFRSCN